MLYRIRDQSDIDGVRVSAHTFRHSFARMRLEHGGAVYSLSRLLAHAIVQITEVYLRDFQSCQARQTRWMLWLFWPILARSGRCCQETEKPG